MGLLRRSAAQIAAADSMRADRRAKVLERKQLLQACPQLQKGLLRSEMTKADIDECLSCPLPECALDPVRKGRGVGQIRSGGVFGGVR